MLMRSMNMDHRLWSLMLGLPLACGTAGGDLYEAEPRPTETANDFLSGTAETDSELKANTPAVFPGGGTSDAAGPLVASLAPQTSNECDPQAVASGSPSGADVQTVCFYGADDSDVPAAIIEQVLEVVGNDEWVHLRLTLNPAFADNSYGENAIGWGDPADDADAPAPPGAPPPAGADLPVPPDPAPPAPGAAPPANRPAAPDAATPDAGAPRPAADGAGRPGGERPGAPGEKAGHTFRDLVGSDHAEIQLLDSNGDVAVHFKLDYLSESSAAPSGYESLGVDGGEGDLLIGEPEWILASATSMDRNLNACGLGSFLEDSPATDESYTPHPDASDWDYRVAYEVWVSSAAFGNSGFGSALIENVHASPSKGEGNTLDVEPAPCPTDPDDPNAVPEPIPPTLQRIR
jgi:hypothetical protein